MAGPEISALDFRRPARRNARTLFPPFTSHPPTSRLSHQPTLDPAEPSSKHHKATANVCRRQNYHRHIDVSRKSASTRRALRFTPELTPLAARSGLQQTIPLWPSHGLVSYYPSWLAGPTTIS